MTPDKYLPTVVRECGHFAAGLADGCDAVRWCAVCGSIYNGSTWAKPTLQAIPTGIAFNVETALTQARMAKNIRETADVWDDNVDARMTVHLDSVIEQLTEIDAKIKSQSRTAP